MATPTLYTTQGPALPEVFASVFEHDQDPEAEGETNGTLLNQISLLLLRLWKRNSTLEQGNATLVQSIKSAIRGEELHSQVDDPPSQLHDYTTGDVADRLLEDMPSDQPSPLQVQWALVEKMLKLHNSMRDDFSHGMQQSSGVPSATNSTMSSPMHSWEASDVFFAEQARQAAAIHHHASEVSTSTVLRSAGFRRYEDGVQADSSGRDWDRLAQMSAVIDDQMACILDMVHSYIDTAPSGHRTPNSDQLVALAGDLEACLTKWSHVGEFALKQRADAEQVNQQTSQTDMTVLNKASMSASIEGSASSGMHAAQVVASSSHIYVPSGLSAQPAEKPLVAKSKTVRQPARLLHHQLVGTPPSLALAARSSEGAANPRNASLPANQMQHSHHPGAASIAAKDKANAKAGSDMRSLLPKSMAASPAIRSWQEPLPPGLVANAITPGLAGPKAPPVPMAPQSPSSRTPKNKAEHEAKRGDQSRQDLPMPLPPGVVDPSMANAPGIVGSGSAAATGSGACASAASIATAATEPAAEGPTGRATRRDEPLPAGVTTLIVRNVPARCSQHDLLKLWPAIGSYNFLHLPYNHSRRCTIGCVLLNFVSHEAAVAFQERWDGEYLIPEANAKRLDCSVAKIQGLDNNLWHLKKTKKTSRIKNWRYLPVLMADDGSIRNFPQVLSETVVPADFAARSPADDILDSDHDCPNPELSSSSLDADSRTRGSHTQ